jgi:microcompartment protein CcmL/EutN
MKGGSKKNNILHLVKRDIKNILKNKNNLKKEVTQYKNFIKKNLSKQNSKEQKNLMKVIVQLNLLSKKYKNEKEYKKELNVYQKNL